MTDWQTYWATSPNTVGNTEYLKQVGHTINGQPYTEQQFQKMILGICQRLEINKKDLVLDLCCGNGVITLELAKRCTEAVGIDFSQPLLEIATQNHSATNLSYKYLNVMKLDELLPAKENQFSKILMYGALQHFQRSDLSSLLSNIFKLATEDAIILFGGVPDEDRKGNFYTSPKQKWMHFIYKISGKDRIGTWWSKSFIRKICEPLNLQCQFETDSEDRPGYNYRFDVKITRKSL